MRIKQNKANLDSKQKSIFLCPKMRSTLKKNYISLGTQSIIIVTVFGLVIWFMTCAPQGAPSLRFEISFPESLSGEPITGRMFVMITRNADREPRFQVGAYTNRPGANNAPLFGVDVKQLEPGESVVIDENTLGYPPHSLRDIPAGDYYVQALLNVYTEFHRSDGHVIWAHMDQWEGQKFNLSPGNLLSEGQKVHIDPDAGYTVKLSLTRVIPPIDIPPDTKWVKRIKMQSKLLTEFWGHPIYLGATVLLPKGYEEHSNVYYPVLYYQGHFSLDAPFYFTAEEPSKSLVTGSERERQRRERRYQLSKHWISDDFPRMIVVNFQHPTPYYDDSYGVNSANNGPYGDAIMTELIPHIEEHFRIIRKPYARLLTGGSTGGWISLALQVYHPEFFGGTWTFCPDPVDFRRHVTVNIYEDENAFVEPGHEWLVPERGEERSPEGQVWATIRQNSQIHAVLGSKGRSGEYLDMWEAVYGPVGEDGYPKPVWDKLTGVIDHKVAEYWRENGYDLRYYIETNWPKIGPHLVGKLHIYCGDMDNYYLNLAVYMLEDSLKNTKNPFYGGSFTYGRPMVGHGWVGVKPLELLKTMARHITKNAPRGENTAAWKYK
ncbi:hypothetical protein LCGC14_0885830 [marine sediment metagenome]|uniref:Esterase n=1 Tax=marine sediment metagenome TaxID=412755 RepID=A0A0F9P5L6_9ZZZZ|nr:hypothetical protein [Candidatus Aminicenantes bacterium]HEB34953.1 hypothetical protein [Candidatus Aminicenantes bacterium]